MKKPILFYFLFTLFLFPVLAQNTNYRILIGTYTNTGKSKGIYSYDINMKTGVFTERSVTAGVSNPSFLNITPDRKFVYSACENTVGSANAFSFNEKTEKLTLLNSSFTKGEDPCFISSTENHVFTANYGGGSLSVFGRNADGSLTDVLQVIQHTGKSINTERQNKPHVHQALISPDNKYLLVNDLGTDKVTVYQYNPISKNNVLVPYDTLSVKPGSGPRHSAFSKDGKKVYLLQEVDGSVSVLGMKNGRLNLIQETTIIKNAKVATGAADIHLSPDEKYLYATNRGTANDITCFSVGADGRLTFKQQVSSKGYGPRNFAISPDGQYLFVANQLSDNIVIFKRDILTGLLTDTGKRIGVGAPVCLLFY